MFYTKYKVERMNENYKYDLQDRQRTPRKHLRRCLEKHIRFELSMSEALGEEVTTGHLKALLIHQQIRIMHGVHLRMIVKTK